MVSTTGLHPSAADPTRGSSEADGRALLDRAADEHHRRLCGQPVPFRQRIEHRNIRGPVQHQTEGAVVTVLEQQDDRAIEVGVADDRSGHQQPAPV